MVYSGKWCGKSTLIKLLAGELTALSGTVQLAKGVQLGYFAQHQLDTLRADESALWHMQKLAPEQAEQQIRDYLGSFAFHGDKVNQAVKSFSGGEKSPISVGFDCLATPEFATT